MNVHGLRLSRSIKVMESLLMKLDFYITMLVECNIEEAT